MTSQLLNTTAWVGFATGKGAEFAIGGPTLEMWVASWNAVSDYKGETDFRKIELDECDEYGYRFVLEDTDQVEDETSSWYTNSVSCVESEAQFNRLETDYSTYWKNYFGWENAQPENIPAVEANGVTGKSWRILVGFTTS